MSRVKISYKDHGVQKNVTWATSKKIESGTRKLVELQKATQNICITGFAGSFVEAASIVEAVNDVTRVGDEPSISNVVAEWATV